jgi:NAD(P)-dependent dehydrogenase (short-subunit alcohol dehydrogenase family)
MAIKPGRLDGKVVLISGTGGGQGRVAARIFADEGAKVVGCDINAQTAQETAQLVHDQGHEMLTADGSVDLADPAQAKAWIALAVEAFGTIDVLYNNASLPRFAPFGQMPDEDYAFTVRNELDLTWHATQAAWPHLADGGGAVVNVASIAAILGLRDLPQSAHAAAKGAVIGMTRQLAAEGAAMGIRVNCISPGVINSPPVQEMLSLGAQGPLAPVIGATALGRPGEPEDIVYAALYLASDEARWVTGAHLVVDGGSSALL